MQLLLNLDLSLEGFSMIIQNTQGKQKKVRNSILAQKFPSAPESLFYILNTSPVLPLFCNWEENEIYPIARLVLCVA